MASAAKFIRGLEGNMRLRVNNKPIPDYAKGFKNPVPRPPNGGNGYIVPVVKFIAKGFKYAPLMLLYDLIFPKPVSDGTLPSWIKDVGEQQEVDKGIPTNFTGGQSQVNYIVTGTSARNGVDYCETPNLNNNWGLSVPGPIHGVKAKYIRTDDRYSCPNYTSIVGKADLFLAYLSFGSNPDDDRYSIIYFYEPHKINDVVKIVNTTRADGLPDTGGNRPPEVEPIKSDSTTDASKAVIDGLNTSTYKIRSVLDPILFPEKFGYKPNAIPQPTINPRPAVIPTEIPQPIPDPDEDVDRKAPPIELPSPGETEYPKINPVPRPAKSPIPNEFPEPKINPDPQPDVNPKPDETPKPEKKWSKITTYLPYPPVIIKTTNPKPPIVLDKTPTPLPLPEPVKPPPPIQTPIDKCADHCGSGTIDFNLPDDSELAELLKAIKKKVDEIEQSVNQTLDGSIEVGSCELPKDQTNETDEIVYVPNPAEKITYSEKGLKAIHTALQGIETKLTGMHEGICVTNDIPSAIPEWWQVRAGSDRPQLVVIFQGGTSKWSMAIPWYKGSYKSKIIELVPNYTRGSFSTVLTLNDNSKVVVNASSKAEGEKVMTQIKALINGSLLQNSELKSGGERKGRQIKAIKVKPVYAKYFAHGQQNDLPDWRYNFKTKKFTKYDRADT